MPHRTSEMVLWNRIEMSPPLMARAFRRLTSITRPSTKPRMIGAISKPALRINQPKIPMPSIRKMENTEAWVE
ncbi:hypothetical protein D3C87_1883570 [compost metagenome]